MILVSGLKHESPASLSKITSGDNVDYFQVRESLCQCARDILQKYEGKLHSAHSRKQQAKTRAAQAMLFELTNNMPANANQEKTRELISSALEKHVEALQGYEHLLTKRGNAYALMEQTEGLRESDTRASLLRYHSLKDELLGSDSPLGDEQKNLLALLAKKKSLALKTLEALADHHGMTNEQIAAINKVALVKPDWFSAVLEHEDSVAIGNSVFNLNEAGLLTPQLCSEISGHEDFGNAVIALEMLNRAGLFEEALCAEVLKHKHPVIAAAALVRLNEIGMLKPEFYSRVLEHEKPDAMAEAAVMLVQEGLYTADTWSALLKCKNPHIAVVALGRLGLNELDTPDNRRVIFNQENPYEAVKIMVELCKTTLSRLNEAGLLTPELWAGILRHKDHALPAEALVMLYGANLFRPEVCVAVLKHDRPDIAARVFMELNSHGLDTPDNYSVVFKQENPHEAAKTMVRLSTTILKRVNEAGLLTPELWAGILEHEEPDRAAVVPMELHDANLFESKLCADMIAHRNAHQAVEAFIQLKQRGLAGDGNYLAAFNCKNPLDACMAIIYLQEHRLLTDATRDKVLAQENPIAAAKELREKVEWSLVNDTPDSSLRYDELKDKLLGSDTLLTREQRDFISELIEKKDLPLKILEALNLKPAETARVLMQSGVLEQEKPDRFYKAFMELNQYGLDTPDNCSVVFRQENPYESAKTMVELSTTTLKELNEQGLLTPELWAGILGHKKPLVAARAPVRLYKAHLFNPKMYAKVVANKKPEDVAKAFISLKQKRLLTATNCSAVSEHNDPRGLGLAIIHLHSINLLTEENLAKVAAHEKPVSIATALGILDTENLLQNDPELCNEVLKNKNADDAAKAVVNLIRAELNTPANCSAVAKHDRPSRAFTAINYLHSYHYLTDERRDEVLEESAGIDPMTAAVDEVNRILSFNLSKVKY